MTTAVTLVTGVTGAGSILQSPLDNSNNPATTSFVNQQINRSIATLPLAMWVWTDGVNDVWTAAA